MIEYILLFIAWWSIGFTLFVFGETHINHENVTKGELPGLIILSFFGPIIPIFLIAQDSITTDSQRVIFKKTLTREEKLRRMTS